MDSRVVFLQTFWFLILAAAAVWSVWLKVCGVSIEENRWVLLFI